MADLLSIVEALGCGRPGCACQRRFGNNLVTHCPAHDDQTPSLSVKEQPDGKTLVHCNAGCMQAAVIDALTGKGLWQNERQQKAMTATAPKPSPGRSSARAVEVASYDYADEGGGLVYQVIRKEPKGFSQRRPDGKGGWVYSLEGVRRLPYRLPELVAGVERCKVVYIVEGEKDADRLLGLGLVSTCNSGGAGKWQAEFADHLCGAGVVILPDNDEPGRRHAQQVAASLLGKAKRIRIVELPGLPEKGDVSDWLDAGGTLEELKTLVRNTLDWEPSPDAAAMGTPEEPTTVMADACDPAEAWEPIVPLGHHDLPAFPVEALPPSVGDYVSEVAHSMQVPLDMPAMIALSVAAVACARRCRIQIGTTHSEPLNLYVATVMEPGSRKSGAMDAMAFPIREVEREMVLAAVPGIASAKERLAVDEKRLGHLRDAAAKDAHNRADLLSEIDTLLGEMSTPPSPPRLLAEDATPEAVAAMMADQRGTLAVLTAEGGIFGILAGRYSEGKANIDLFLKGHSGEEYRVDRKGSLSLFIQSACLTMGLAVQPDVLRSLADTPGFRGRGLLGRFLYCLPEDMVGTRMYQARPVDPLTRERFGQAIRSLLDMPDAATEDDPYRRHVLTLDGTSLEIWAHYADDIERRQAEGGDLRGVRDWASKLAGQVARVAGILHLALHAGPSTPWTIPILPETVAAAWSIGEYLIPHALAAFGEMGASSEVALARRILGWVVRTGKDEFSVRDCHQSHRDVKSPTDLVPPLTLLCERGYLRQAGQSGSGGRGRPKSPIYQVNPAAHKSHKSHK